MNIENTTINANDLINDLVKEIMERRAEIALIDDGIVKSVATSENALMTYMIDRVLSKHLEKVSMEFFWVVYGNNNIHM